MMGMMMTRGDACGNGDDVADGMKNVMVMMVVTMQDHEHHQDDDDDMIWYDIHDYDGDDDD